MTWATRVMIFLGWAFLAWYFYRTCIVAERRLRGTANMPSGVKIGCVVYFDFAKNGQECGRVVIGLLTEDCPLYCEYFHRRCTGSGGNGDSFRGLRLVTVLPKHVACFGDGSEMTHEVPGFTSKWLPTEKESAGAWRGALSAISYERRKQSPNFMVHISAGDYTPQIFGMVLSGYDTIEQMNRVGTTRGGMSKSEFVVEGCGELCTLDKSRITPLPWRLYESISVGYDADKFGQAADPSLLIPPSQKKKAGWLGGK